MNRFRALAKRVNALCVYKIASNIILLKSFMNSGVDKKTSHISISSPLRLGFFVFS